MKHQAYQNKKRGGMIESRQKSSPATNTRATLAIGTRFAAMEPSQKATEYAETVDTMERIQSGKFGEGEVKLPEANDFTETDFSSLQAYLRNQMSVRQAELNKGKQSQVIEEESDDDWTDSD